MKTENRVKIAFLGGDMRVATSAKKLADIGWKISAWRVPECNMHSNITQYDSMYKALADVSAVILPLPASSDGMTLNCKTENSETNTALTLIADAISSDCIIIGGKLPKSFVNYAQTKGIRTFDYFEAEAFQIKNAYTTAEAALNIAMNNLAKNIKGTRVAITGYGRIAKQLVRLLRLLDVNVTLLARKDSDLTWAALEGCETLKLPQSKNDANTVMKLTQGYDVIFNTVPHWLFDEKFLKELDRSTLIIDLASAPGGVDISEAKKLRLNVLWATSLPGKYAPESAGELIFDCIRDILETEVKV